MASSSSDTSGPVGGVPVVVAVLSTEPWATSASVTVWDCAGSSGQLVVAPTARLATHGRVAEPEHRVADRDVGQGTLPVLVTSKV